METIYLIGFMGSGKSTVGEELQCALGATHLDTDQMVIDQYGDISSIFAEIGEQGFRTYETEMLAGIPGDDYIVSTGGGIVERQVNHTLMQRNGLIIFLNTSFAEISSRLGDDTTRPLWGRHDSDKYKLFKRRQPLYTALANKIIDTDQKTPEMIMSDILAMLPDAYE